MRDENRIGIWKIKDEKNYIRDPAKYKEYSNWAWTLTFPLQKQTKRFVYIGDSVGMGHYYRQHITPAIVLQKLSDIETESAEVIDLSRYKLTFKMTLDLMSDSTVLDPDAIIIFFGNALWSESVRISDVERQDLRRMMFDGDFDGIKKILLSKYSPLLNQFIESVNRIYIDYGIPVYFILPPKNPNLKEFNVNHYLRGYYGKTPKHFKELTEQVKAFFLLGRFVQAEHVLKEMIEINPINPCTYEYLLETSRMTGNYEQENFCIDMLYELQALDECEVYLTNSFVKQEFIERTNQKGFHIIDLQTPLEAGKEVKSEFFINARYLSINGMEWAMNRVLYSFMKSGMLQKKAKRESEKIQYGEQLSAIIGRAELLSAITDGQTGNQSYERLFHQCLKAMQHWPRTELALTMYLDVAISNIPWYFHKYYTELTKFGIWTVFPENLQEVGNIPIQTALIRAITDVLTINNKQLKSEIYDKLLASYGSLDDRVDLLESSYEFCKSMKNRVMLPNEESEYGYYIAFTPQTSFCLLADGKSDIVLRLTISSFCENEQTENVTLSVNNISLCKLMITGDWSNHEIRIPKERFTNGVIHQLMIEWPVDVPCSPLTRIPMYGRIFEGSVIKV